MYPLQRFQLQSFTSFPLLALLDRLHFVQVVDDLDQHVFIEIDDTDY